MSVSTIATLSRINADGRSPAASPADASVPPADPHHLDLRLDSDLFDGTLFVPTGRSDGPAWDFPPAEAIGDRDGNGSGTGIAAVSASGDQGIDGLLRGVRWDGGFITYSFPASADGYQADHPEPFTNAGQINPAQQVAAHFALDVTTHTQPAAAVGFAVEGFTDLGIGWNPTEGAGTIRLINTEDPPTAYAYYPTAAVYGGDAFFGPSGRSPVMGNYHWHTMLHEIGHSLGLKHGQDMSMYGALPASVDSMEYSVMTYRSYVNDPLTSGYRNETYGFAQTYMMYDIAALQYMYGADFTTNAGNTTYSWNPDSGDTIIDGSAAITPGANRIFMTVWDGGGVDTYDASAYTTGVSIDLRPGGNSLLSGTQQANLGNGNHARGNVFNALQHNGDARSLIENATGGSGGDILHGNDADNLLTGNGGNDFLWGGDGSDTLRGGSGVDSIFGLGGDDWVHSGDGNTIDAIQDGGDGMDVLCYSDFGLNGYTFDMAAGVIRRGDTVHGTMANFETLHGGHGNDIMIAATGPATMYGGAGIDTLDLRASNRAHDLNLTTGTAGNGALYLEFERVLLGGGNDTILGTEDADTIDGGRGSDSMVGLGGNDTYWVNRASDIVIEAPDGGVDWINSTVNLTLAANVENLKLRGNALNGTGNALDNVINGNAGDNRLNGGSGGNDTLRGHGGNDTYIVNAGDQVIEKAGQGIDTMRSWMTNTLAANVENLTLTGGGDIDGTGNSLANVISGTRGSNVLNGARGNDTLLGNGGADTLLGGWGDDRLDGGAGADRLTGGGGADNFVYRAGADRITDFADDIDTLLLDDLLWGGAALTVNEVLTMARVVAGNTIFDFGGGNTLTVERIADKTLLADDMAFI